MLSSRALNRASIYPSQWLHLAFFSSSSSLSIYSFAFFFSKVKRLTDAEEGGASSRRGRFPAADGGDVSHSQTKSRKDKSSDG